MVLEPLLYSESAGVSGVGLLVAVAFWTWLWGPVGLVLATPLTVCVVVLGKYVPGMDFIGVLISDQPAMESNISYYQRLLAMDQAEAAEIVEEHLKTHPQEQLFDGVLIPALNYARRDRELGRLTEDGEQFVFRATREILDDLNSLKPQVRRKYQTLHNLRRSTKTPRLSFRKFASWDVLPKTKRTNWHSSCSGSCSIAPNMKSKLCRTRCSPPKLLLGLASRVRL